MNRSVRSLMHVAAVLVLAPLAAQAQSVSRVATRDLSADLACGARATGMPQDRSIQIAPGREYGKVLFGPDETLVINAGAARGVKVGQEYYVRRMIEDRFVHSAGDNLPLFSIHTAGWVRILDATNDSAIAEVIRACDGIQEGDYLELYVKPEVPSPAAEGQPDYTNPGHVVLGDDRRQMGAGGDLMVLDRGSDHGIHAGQRLTIFRTTGRGTGPVARIAEATAVVISPETSVIRIDKTSDAVIVGDLVAIHRIPNP